MNIIRATRYKIPTKEEHSEYLDHIVKLSKDPTISEEQRDSIEEMFPGFKEENDKSKTMLPN